MDKSIRVLIVLFSIFIACENPESVPWFEEDEAFHVSFYSGRSGNYPDGGPGHFIEIATEEIFPCCNYEITLDKREYESKTRISLEGINIPGICFTALGPASARTEIELSNGDYRIEVSNGHVWNTIYLDVSDSLIAVVDADTSILTVDDTPVWKFRRNTFYYGCTSDTGTAWMYSAFLDSIKTTPSISEFTFADYGRIPFERSSDSRPAHYFSYESELDWELVKQKLGRFVEENISENEYIYFILENYEADHVFSWLDF